MSPKNINVHQLLSGAVLRLPQSGPRFQTFPRREPRQSVPVTGDHENRQPPLPPEIALHVEHRLQLEHLCVEPDKGI